MPAPRPASLPSSSFKLSLRVPCIAAPAPDLRACADPVCGTRYAATPAVRAQGSLACDPGVKPERDVEHSHTVYNITFNPSGPAGLNTPIRD
ncbi:hypothetical protein KRMM14A1004_06470 [Krasilnikovia sp. MM14-A1004]